MFLRGGHNEQKILLRVKYVPTIPQLPRCILALRSSISSEIKHFFRSKDMPLCIRKRPFIMALNDSSALLVLGMFMPVNSANSL